MEALATVCDERGDPDESAIKWMALEKIQKTLILKVSYHDPTNTHHDYTHGLNQSSSPSVNPERYNKTGKKLHNNLGLL